MFRLSFVEFACIVAIGMAMVAPSSGDRFFRLPETLTVPAPAGPGPAAGTSPIQGSVTPPQAEGHR